MNDDNARDDYRSRLSELRLLHLTSPSLPLGSFAYSQGLEWAIEEGWIKNEVDLKDWLGGMMTQIMARLDIPVLARCHSAWPDNVAQLANWDRFLIACRETSELRQEELDRGRTLMRCLAQLNHADVQTNYSPVSFVCGYSLATRNFGIKLLPAAQGYVWSWLENQIMAATRLIPLGQSAAQSTLFDLAADIPATVDLGLALGDNELGSSALANTLASARHETQYTRLFRS